MKEPVYVGEDPGKEGWISVVNAKTLALIESHPVPATNVKGDYADRAGRCALIGRLKDEFDLRLWVLEQQDPGGGMGYATSFMAQARANGITVGALTMAGVPLVEIGSKVWRKEFGLSQTRTKPAPKPGKTASAEEVAAWKKSEIARKKGQREDSLQATIQKVQALYPLADLRPTAKSKKPSADKAVSILLARMGATWAPVA